MLENRPENYTITLDDDPTVSRIIEQATKMKTHAFTTTRELLNNLEKLQPVAVFVDIELGSGDKSGLEIIPNLRRAWPFTPLLVVTSSPTESVITQAFLTGADDFIRKPLILEEVAARVKLRLDDSVQKVSKRVIDFGDIKIDSAHRTVSGPKGKRYASPIEISLLTNLAGMEGAIVEKEALKIRCWGQIKVTDNALHRKLHAVRALLKDVSDRVTIVTKYGVGFALKMEAEYRIAS